MTELLECGMEKAAVVAAPRSRWMAVMSHLDPRYGGLSAVVPRLGLEMERDGVEVALAGFCAAGEFCMPSGYEGGRMSEWPVSRMAWWRDGTLRERMRAAVREVDGVHVHGLWEQSTAVACAMAREADRPYVLSAHGMLEPWALRNKRIKKRVYAAAVERGNVQGAACLHALTRAEASHYRAFGARGPIAIVPNGVTVPERMSGEMFLEAHPELRGRRLVLFLSRLHPKKGLDVLLSAWALIEKKWPEAQVVIAGPDFEGTRERMEALALKNGIAERVTFTGMLEGAMKWSALAAAECFVLPSHSEGLSMSALEAMGAGLPVIVTRQCNMPEVRDLGLGWEIEPAADALMAALKEVLEHSAAANASMGNRGRLLVEERYGWGTVAWQMAGVYGWVLGGPQPDGVEVLRG